MTGPLLFLNPWLGFPRFIHRRNPAKIQFISLSVSLLAVFGFLFCNSQEKVLYLCRNK